MTIVYRVQARPITDEDPDTPLWLCEWIADKATAGKKHEECMALGWPVRTTKHDIPTDRDSLCAALNMAGVNFTVWPGEEVFRDEPEPDTRRPTAGVASGS